MERPRDNSKRAAVPQFGAWDQKGDTNANYSVVFSAARANRRKNSKEDVAIKVGNEVEQNKGDHNESKQPSKFEFKFTDQKESQSQPNETNFGTQQQTHYLPNHQYYAPPPPPHYAQYQPPPQDNAAMNPQYGAWNQNEGNGANFTAHQAHPQVAPRYNYVQQQQQQQRQQQQPQQDDTSKRRFRSYIKCCVRPQ